MVAVVLLAFTANAVDMVIGDVKIENLLPSVGKTSWLSGAWSYSESVVWSSTIVP